MRKYAFLWTAMAALLFAQSATAAIEQISFDNNSGAAISFTYGGTGSNAGANFTFLPNGPGAKDFHITGISGFTGSNVLNGLNGDIEGNFHFNHSDITGNFFTGESAPVSGAGMFIIHDGLGNDFTAALAWNNIGSLWSSEELNYTGAVNLSNFQYSGANAQLLQLLHSSNGTVDAQFGFGLFSGLDLYGLSSYDCNETHSTAFSGTLTATPSAIPEPSTYGFLMAAMLGAMGVARRIGKAR